MAGAQHHLLLPESIPALAAEPAERLRSPARLGMAAILGIFFLEQEAEAFPPPAAADACRAGFAIP